MVFFGGKDRIVNKSISRSVDRNSGLGVRTGAKHSF